MAKKFSDFQESDGAQAGEWLVAHTELDNYKFPAKSLLSTKAVTGTFDSGVINVSPGNAGAVYVEIDTDVTSLIIEGVQENTLFPLYIKNVDSASHNITLATPGFSATVNVVSDLALHAGATRAFMVYAYVSASNTGDCITVTSESFSIAPYLEIEYYDLDNALPGDDHTALEGLKILLAFDPTGISAENWDETAPPQFALFPYTIIAVNKDSADSVTAVGYFNDAGADVPSIAFDRDYVSDTNHNLGIFSPVIETFSSNNFYIEDITPPAAEGGNPMSGYFYDVFSCQNAIDNLIYTPSFEGTPFQVEIWNAGTYTNVHCTLKVRPLLEAPIYGA